MGFHAIAFDANVAAKALKLLPIGKGTVLIDGVVFVEFKIDKVLMVSGKARFIIVGHEGGRYAARVVVAAVQPRLIDDGSLSQQFRFFFDQANAHTLLRQVQSRVHPKNATPDHHYIKLRSLHRLCAFRQCFHLFVNICIIKLMQLLVKFYRILQLPRF